MRWFMVNLVDLFYHQQAPPLKYQKGTAKVGTHRMFMKLSAISQPKNRPPNSLPKQSAEKSAHLGVAIFMRLFTGPKFRPCSTIPDKGLNSPLVQPVRKKGIGLKGVTVRSSLGATMSHNNHTPALPGTLTRLLRWACTRNGLSAHKKRASLPAR